MAHTLRNCAARIFDTIGVPSQAFKDKDSRRSSPELIALLKPGKNGLYPSLPPLLYPPGNTIDVFQNPVLPLVSIAYHSSPSSHDELMTKFSYSDSACRVIRQNIAYLNASGEFVWTQVGSHPRYDR